MIEQLDETTFVGQALTPFGEPIYFAMETIHPEKRYQWNGYLMMCNTLITGGNSFIGTIGSISEIASFKHDPKGLAQLLGSLAIKFWNIEDVIDLPEIKNVQTSKIPSGINGVNTDKQTHFVYASKTPIIGRFRHSETKLDTFQSFKSHYGNIVMSVGLKLNGECIENRGIFRNPINLGTHANISMLLHQFTTQVADKYFQGIKWFKVRPLAHMGKILCETIPQDKLLINGKHNQEFYEECEITVLIQDFITLPIGAKSFQQKRA